MKVKELITLLNGMSDEMKEKDVKVQATNFMLFSPCIRYVLIDKYEPLNLSPENIETVVLRWE